MENNKPNEVEDQEINEVVDKKILPTITQDVDTIPSLTMASDHEGEKCLACEMKSVPSTFIYAIGRVHYLYPNESLKNEALQALFRAGIPDNIFESERLGKLFSKDNKSEFYYLATKLCWIFSLDTMDEYILIPNTAMLLDGLISTLPSVPRDVNKKLMEEPIVDLIVGKKGPISPPGMCGNLVLPLVELDQVSTYRIKDILKVLKEKWNDKLGVPKDKFEKYIDDIFERMIEATRNEGAMDEQRALNYLVIRASSIYVESAKLQHRSLFLEDITSLPVTNVGIRKIAEVVFSYRSETPGGLLERYSMKVDVTDEFPFPVSGFSAYYSR